MTKILIHAVYADGDIFTCHHPECKFVGDLSEAAWHVVQNQFTVVAEKKKRPADLFKI